MAIFFSLSMLLFQVGLQKLKESEHFAMQTVLAKAAMKAWHMAKTGDQHAASKC